MTEKIALITGGTSGLGRSMALALGDRGFKVIVHGRDPGRLGATIAELCRFSKNQDFFPVVADFSRLSDVQRLAREVQERFPHLDVLINNAGAVHSKREVTVDGNEMTLQVNYLAPFLLTQLLLEGLKKSAPSRVINVSSGLHFRGRINFDDIQFKKDYSWSAAYNQSKLALLMSTYALARRLEGTQVTANALNPGWVATGLGSNAGLRISAGMKLAYLFGRSPEKGAQTAVYLAFSDAVKDVSGKYFYDQREARSSDEARNEDEQERLWKMSEALVGSQ
jgi:NAD(P)-dependent dehydrogenase (short-subunit alcohol dehydrogenase family)